MRHLIGNQCSSFMSGVTWSLLLLSMIMRAHTLASPLYADSWFETNKIIQFVPASYTEVGWDSQGA